VEVVRENFLGDYFSSDFEGVQEDRKRRYLVRFHGEGKT
jgi:hypothetical protein